MGFMEPITTHEPEPHGEPATLPVITEYIGVRPGYCGGEPHILGHRIKVRHVASGTNRWGWRRPRCGHLPDDHPRPGACGPRLLLRPPRRDPGRIEDEVRLVEALKAKTPSLLQDELQRLKGEDVTDDTLPPG